MGIEAAVLKSGNRASEEGSARKVEQTRGIIYESGIFVNELSGKDSMSALTRPNWYLRDALTPEALLAKIAEEGRLGRIGGIKTTTTVYLPDGRGYDHLNCEAGSDAFTARHIELYDMEGQGRELLVETAGIDALARHIAAIANQKGAVLQEMYGAIDTAFVDPRRVVDFYAGDGDSHSNADDRCRIVLRLPKHRGLHEGMEVRFRDAVQREQAVQQVVAGTGGARSFVDVDTIAPGMGLGFCDNLNRSCRLYMDPASIFVINASGFYNATTFEYKKGSTCVSALYAGGSIGVGCEDDMEKAKAIVGNFAGKRAFLALDEAGTLLVDPSRFLRADAIGNNQIFYYFTNDRGPLNRYYPSALARDAAAREATRRMWDWRRHAVPGRFIGASPS